METARLCTESQEDLRAKNIFCILNINFSLYLLVYLLFELIMVLISLKFQLPTQLMLLNMAATCESIFSVDNFKSNI